MAGVVLCFIQNYYGKCTKSEIVNRLTGFYEEDECSNAKEILVAAAVDTKVEGIALPKVRKHSANKQRLECEDMLNLFDFMDKKQAILPVFAAVKIHRIPKIFPSDVDVVILAGTIESLKKYFAILQGIITPAIIADVIIACSSSKTSFVGCSCGVIIVVVGKLAV